MTGLVDDIAPHAGTAAIRLAGHGGSGKTTTLVLLATRLAAHHDRRVAILSFHHAPCNDIRRVIVSLPDARSTPRDWLHVETATDFLLSILEAAGIAVPYAPGGEIAFDRLPQVYRKATGVLVDAETAELVRAESPSPKTGATRSAFSFSPVTATVASSSPTDSRSW